MTTTFPTTWHPTETHVQCVLKGLPFGLKNVLVSATFEHGGIDVGYFRPPGPEQRAAMVRMVAKDIDPEQMRLRTHGDFLRWRQYAFVPELTNAHYNSSSFNRGMSFRMTMYLLNGPKLKRAPLPPLPPLKEAVAMARAKANMLTIDPSLPWVLAYDSFRIPYTEGYASKEEALKEGILMSEEGQGVPLGIVHEGVLDYWYWDTIARAKLTRHIRFFRILCEERGLQVRKVGEQLPQQ